MYAGREPNDAEIDAVVSAIDRISRHITHNGKISASGWREVYGALAALSDYELWLGLQNLGSAVFDSGENASCVQLTLFELFEIAYEQGIENLS